MAAGRLVVPGWTPAVDADGVPIPNARMFFYLNKTTTLATVYADEALTVPLPNPLPANSAGQWLPVWADDANLFSVAVEAPYGPPGVPFTFDDLGPSTSSNAGALNKLDRDGGNAEPGVAVNIGAVRVTGDTITGPTEIVGPFQLRDLGQTVPPEGVYFGSGGNSLSYQTLISSPEPPIYPDFDNQRGQVLIVTTTTDDGNSEENALCLLTTIETGYAKTWAQSTAFSIGDNIMFHDARNAVYRCIQSGISAAVGNGPSGLGQDIVDGTCRWRWINAAAINGKVGIYNEVVIKPGAGSSWAQANNLEILPGAIPPFVVNTEFDLSNKSGVDSDLGGSNLYNLYIATQGPNRSTSSIEVVCANDGDDPYGALWGMHFVGPKLAERSVICIDSSSQIGVGLGPLAGGVVQTYFTDSAFKDSSIAARGLSLVGTYSEAAIEVTGDAPVGVISGGAKAFAGFADVSTSPVGYRANGSYSNAGFEAAGASAVGFSSSSSKSVAGYIDGSTAPFGFQAIGDYSSAPFSSNGFAVTPNGEVVAAGVRFAGLLIDAADDAAAAAVGVLIGGVYRTGSVLKVRVS